LGDRRQRIRFSARFAWFRSSLEGSCQPRAGFIWSARCPWVANNSFPTRKPTKAKSPKGHKGRGVLELESDSSCNPCVDRPEDPRESWRWDRCGGVVSGRTGRGGQARVSARGLYGENK
jgi:hypothetical protein